MRCDYIRGEVGFPDVGPQVKAGVGIAVQVGCCRWRKYVWELQQPLRGRTMNKATRPYE